MDRIKYWLEMAMMSVVTIAGVAAIFPVYQYISESDVRRAERISLSISALSECEKMSKKRAQEWLDHVNSWDRDVPPGVVYVLSPGVTDEVKHVREDGVEVIVKPHPNANSEENIQYAMAGVKVVQACENLQQFFEKSIK